MKIVDYSNSDGVLSFQQCRHFGQPGPITWARPYVIPESLAKGLDWVCLNRTGSFIGHKTVIKTVSTLCSWYHATLLANRNLYRFPVPTQSCTWASKWGKWPYRSFVPIKDWALSASTITCDSAGCQSVTSQELWLGVGLYQQIEHLWWDCLFV